MHVLKILVVIFIVYETFLIIRSEKTIQVFMENNKKDSSLNYDIPDCYYVIPCYKEDSIINETVEYFATNFPRNKLVFVCGYENRNNDSYVLLKNAINNYNEITLLYDDNKLSTKSSKLNYAVEYLNKYEKGHFYLGVYDFDSRPLPQTVSWLAKELSTFHNNVKCYQQIPLTLDGVDFSKPIISTYSIFSLRRSLGIEGYNLRKRYNEKEITYLMGSGMFLRNDLINSLNGFSDISDDLKTGYKLYFRREKQKIIPILNSVSAVISNRDLVNQGKRIFLGAFSFINIFKNQNKSAYNFYLLLKLFWSCLQETIILIVNLIAIIYFGLINIDYNIVYVLLLFYLMEFSYYNFVFFRMHKLKKIKNIIIFSIHAIFGFLLPWITRTILLFLFFIDKDNYRLLMKSSQKLR